jgi:hypothetical protein
MLCSGEVDSRKRLLLSIKYGYVRYRTRGGVRAWRCCGVMSGVVSLKVQCEVTLVPSTPGSAAMEAFCAPLRARFAAQQVEVACGENILACGENTLNHALAHCLPSTPLHSTPQCKHGSQNCQCFGFIWEFGPVAFCYDAVRAEDSTAVSD